MEQCIYQNEDTERCELHDKSRCGLVVSVKMLTVDDKPLVTVVETVVEIVATEMIGSLEDDKPSSAMDGSIEIVDTIIHTETMKFILSTVRIKRHNTQHTTHTKHEAQPFHSESPSLVYTPYSILHTPYSLP